MVGETKACAVWAVEPWHGGPSGLVPQRCVKEPAPLQREFALATAGTGAGSKVNCR